MSEHEVSKLAVFEGKRIRKTLHEGEWWFVVEDVVLALTVHLVRDRKLTSARIAGLRPVHHTTLPAPVHRPETNTSRSRSGRIAGARRTAPGDPSWGRSRSLA